MRVVDPALTVRRTHVVLPHQVLALYERSGSRKEEIARCLLEMYLDACLGTHNLCERQKPGECGLATDRYVMSSAIKHQKSRAQCHVPVVLWANVRPQAAAYGEDG